MAHLAALEAAMGEMEAARAEGWRAVQHDWRRRGARLVRACFFAPLFAARRVQGCLHQSAAVLDVCSDANGKCNRPESIAQRLWYTARNLHTILICAREQRRAAFLEASVLMTH